MKARLRKNETQRGGCMFCQAMFAFIFLLNAPAKAVDYPVVAGMADTVKNTARLNTVNNPLSSTNNPRLTATVMLNMQPGHPTFTDPDENYMFPYDPTVSPAHIGGYHLNKPLYAYYNDTTTWQQVTVEQLKQEIRMASYMSIDAFTLCTNFKEASSLRNAHMGVISNYFEAAKQLRAEEGITFYLSLEFCNVAPNLPDADSRLNNAVGYMQELFDNVSPYGQAYGDIWLKDPDGNPIFYIFDVMCPLELTALQTFNKLSNSTEVGDAAYASYTNTLTSAFDFWYSLEYWLTDPTEGMFGGEADGTHFRFIPRLERFQALKVSNAAAYTKYVNWYKNHYVGKVALYFPGMSYWKPYFYAEDDDVFESILEKCSNRSFVSSIWADHANDKYRLVSDPSVVIRDASAVSTNHTPEDVARRCNPARGAERLLNCWSRVLDLSAPSDQLAQVITWNDYEEGHQFAPTLSKNFGYHYINKWFKTIWTTGEEPEIGTTNFPEVATVFFHKYNHSLTSSWYNTTFFLLDGELPTNEWNTMWATSDVIQVVSFLAETGTGTNGQAVGAAKLWVRGNDFLDVPAGMHVSTINLDPSDKGTVRVLFNKHHVSPVGRVIDFTANERITDAPYRDDFGMFVQSSEWQTLYEQYFNPNYAGVTNRSVGEFRILDEYVIESGETLPNYQLRYTAP